MTGNAATRAASETATQVANGARDTAMAAATTADNATAAADAAAQVANATRDIAIAAAATANNTAAVAYNALDTAEEAKVAADRATDVTRSVNF